MFDTNDEYLTAKEIAKAYRISQPTLFRLVKKGLLPKGDLVGLRSRRWRKSAVVTAFEAMSQGEAA